MGRVRWRLVWAALAVVAVTVAAPAVAWAAFSGTNGRVVWVSYRTGSGNLWTVDPTTVTPVNPQGDATRLTATGFDDTTPFVSRNGTRVVFSSNRGGSQEVWTVPLAASNQEANVQNLSNNGGASDDTDPSFSPDNSTVVFSRNIGGSRQLYTLDADDPGAGAVQLLQSTADDFQAVYVPSGPAQGQVVFTRSAPGGTQLWRLDPALPVGPTNPVNLSAVTGGTTDQKADISPDGQFIVFSSRRAHPSAPSSPSPSQIWVMKLDGTGAQPLFSAPTGRSDTRPAFSPDGLKIVFARPGQTSQDVNTLDVPISVSGVPQASGTPHDITMTNDGSSPRDDEPNWAIGTLDPVIPEAPIGVLLPLSAVAVGGTALVWRYRRRLSPA